VKPRPHTARRLTLIAYYGSKMTAKPDTRDAEVNPPLPGVERRRPTTRESWQALERRVLLAKLRDLEQKARELAEVETSMQKLSQKVELLARLRDAALVIHAATNLEELLDAAVAQFVRLVGAETASVLLHEPEEGELVVARAYGACPVQIEGVRLAVGQGVAGYVAQRGEPVWVKDIARDGRFPVRASRRYATGSFLCLPMRAAGRLVGVLNAADRADGRAFDERDLRLAAAFAEELAVAVERVRRVELERKRQHELVSKVAHELRNPLDGALRFINLTMSDHRPEEVRRRYLLATKQGLERINGIVEGLLGFGACARPATEPCHVNDVLRQAVALQEGKAERLGVRVEFDLADRLLRAPDGAGLFQVFTNLVSNALDAMPDGGTLTVRSRGAGDAVVVEVADTGCGMPPEVLQRLFTPFFTTKPPGRGMGLGLAVCREVIERLGGRIEVESKPGHGTVFTVAVPCSRK